MWWNYAESSYVNLISILITIPEEIDILTILHLRTIFGKIQFIKLLNMGKNTDNYTYCHLIKYLI